MSPAEHNPTTIYDYKVLLFDLDGVVTPTADLHRQAWRELFSEFFARHGAKPYEEQDYFDYLDGRSRAEGVAALLTSRNIEVPEGSPDDDPSADTIYGMGERKNKMFRKLLDMGMVPYPGTLRLLDALKNAENAPRVAIVSSSKNAHAVLEAAGLQDRFELVVDGNVAQEKGLAAKPEPDTYLYACLLYTSPSPRD